MIFAAAAVVGAAFLTLGCGADESIPPGYTQLNGGAGGVAGSDSTSSVTSTSTSSSGSGGSGGEPLLGPPYPIVLAHGFFGFEEFAGLDFATYFYGVKDHLAAHGEPLVFTPAVDPFNDSTDRGAQLAAKIQEILEQTGHAKVNIIGHSQGGLDARVVAHEHPELVASVVTLQTPHQGSRIADIALLLVSDPFWQDVLDALVQLVGMAVYDEIGKETSLADALYSFSEPGIEAFNAEYTDQPGIYYASVAGRSDKHAGGDDCWSPKPAPFVTAFDNQLDPIDPLLSITEMLLDCDFWDPCPNDGMVRAQDARWGEFLGCVPADHLDMVGHLFGDSPGGNNGWDYLQFYVDLVQMLRDQGF